jgi:hypothetical protein
MLSRRTRKNRLCRGISAVICLYDAYFAHGKRTIGQSSADFAIFRIRSQQASAMLKKLENLQSQLLDGVPYYDEFYRMQAACIFMTLPRQAGNRLPDSD